MTFKELQKIFEKELGASKLADIAKELDVTPQVVSNWKSRNQVPYKYVLDLRTRIKKLKNQESKARFNLSMDEAKYIHGKLGKGMWTFYGGHDPEDYQHRVGDPPTELELHPNSAGYRLILNNILFPAAKKKKQKT